MLSSQAGRTPQLHSSDCKAVLLAGGPVWQARPKPTIEQLANGCPAVSSGVAWALAWTLAGLGLGHSH
jgi:hypothetical protein